MRSLDGVCGGHLKYAIFATPLLYEDRFLFFLGESMTKF